MVTLEQARMIAEKNYHHAQGHVVVGQAETDAVWVFYFGRVSHVPAPGDGGEIAVSKKDGAWHEVINLSDEFFDLIDCARPIAIS